MSFAPPGDYDEAQSDPPTDGNESAEHHPDEELSDPREEGPAETTVNDLLTDEIQAAIESNSSALETKADRELVRDLLSRVNELQNRLVELEENYQRLHSYLLELEKERRDWVDTVENNETAINPLSAAVFDDGPECPECEDGHLTSRDFWLGKRVVCSNGDCGFERKVTGF